LASSPGSWASPTPRCMPVPVLALAGGRTAPRAAAPFPASPRDGSLLHSQGDRAWPPQRPRSPDGSPHSAAP
jgi:hypothetical protein